MLTDIRLWLGLYTQAERDLVMLSILGDGELTGLEIVELSNGVFRRGTVYVHLESMVDRGVVSRRMSILDGRYRYSKA